MRVLKFGGTSVGTPSRMQDLVEIVATQHTTRIIVVLSAISGVTNDLQNIADLLLVGRKQKAAKQIDKLQMKHINFAKELLPNEVAFKQVEIKINSSFEELSTYTNQDFYPNQVGHILAFGELLSTTLFHSYLQSIGRKSTLLYAPEFMSINANQQPDIQEISERLAYLLNQETKSEIVVTQGFICKNHLNEIDNLQRGGSDYTASLIGAAIKAEEIQIWTDIDGFHNNDPRYVNNTKPVKFLSFDEAAELAYFGAKILHPQSIHPAKKYNIPVRLLDALAPELPGTQIISKKENHSKIVAVAGKDGITAIRIHSSRMLMAYGFLRKVFEVFEKYKTPIDMITTSEVAVSVTIDSTSYLATITEELQKYGEVQVDENQSIVCVVGDFSGDSNGQATVVSDALKHLPVRMISYGGSEHNISMLLPQEHKVEALRSLHSRFF